MSRKKTETLKDDGSYVTGEKKHGNIPAFILCLLLALVIWVYTTNQGTTRVNENHNDTAATCEQSSEV